MGDVSVALMKCMSSIAATANSIKIQERTLARKTKPYNERATDPNQGSVPDADGVTWVPVNPSERKGVSHDAPSEGLYGLFYFGDEFPVNGGTTHLVNVQGRSTATLCGLKLTPGWTMTGADIDIREVTCGRCQRTLKSWGPTARKLIFGLKETLV